MSVEFNDDGSNQDDAAYRSREIIGKPVVPSATSLLLKLGVAKTARQSYYFLMAIFIACVGLSVYILANYSGLFSQTSVNSLSPNLKVHYPQKPFQRNAQP